jgi:hypothetical protein
MMILPVFLMSYLLYSPQLILSIENSQIKVIDNYVSISVRINQVVLCYYLAI